jgi:type VI secretion system secreted protein Hcp
MASDIFLKLDGIKGESTDDKHKDEIDVMSFSWGLTQSGTAAAGGGGGAGKVQFQDFHFTSKVNKASPNLMLSCATGQHIKEGTITVRKAGEGRGDGNYLVIKMSDVLISSYQSSGSAGGDVPSDATSMAFAKIEYSYYPQKADGSLDAPITAGWDLKANKKV